jgi:D-threonate/D-erythronate kinase
MSRILCIADDLTGAAEVAAGAVNRGLSAAILSQPDDACRADVVVVNSDTRDSESHAAARNVGQLCSALEPTRFELIYKKTDSVCRGPVRAELLAMMTALNRKRAVFVPQNPSKLRTVRDGIYRIGSVELNQTEFGLSHAKVANVRELIGLGPGDHAIVTPDAVDAADIAAIAASVQRDDLPAGGIDFFMALLSRLVGAGSTPPGSAGLPDGSRLVVCGTRSVSRSHLTELARRAGVVVVHADMSDADGVRETCLAHLRSAGRCVLMSPDPDGAAGLSGPMVEDFLARLVNRLCSDTTLAVVCAEGGAVASALLKRWRIDQSAPRFTLSVQGELTPGVVVLNVSGSSAVAEGSGAPMPCLVIKPGSYRWPDSVLMP